MNLNSIAQKALEASNLSKQAQVTRIVSRRAVSVLAALLGRLYAEK
jgi:hypothetical protein